MKIRINNSHSNYLSPSDKGTLTIEVPRNIVDHKEGNADDKFTIHVDGSKDAIFREISNNKTASRHTDILSQQV